MGRRLDGRVWEWEERWCNEYEYGYEQVPAGVQPDGLSVELVAWVRDECGRRCVETDASFEPDIIGLANASVNLVLGKCSH